MGTVIVIPTYNEKQNIEKLVNQIFQYQPHVHIIVVDDNSPDGTGKIADKISHQDSRLNVIHRPAKKGLGTAYIAGFKKALADGADIICEMDADFSHKPEYLQSLFEMLDQADLVIGSRYIDGVRVEGWRFRRLLLSKLANMFVSYIIVQPVWDFTAGYRCYRRELLESINLDDISSDGYAFQIEMTHLAFKHGFKVVEIPIVFKEREHGASKISRKVILEAIWITLKCHAPLKEIIQHIPFLFKNYEDFIDTKNRDSR